MVYHSKHHVSPQCDHSYFQSNDQELSQLVPINNMLVTMSLSTRLGGGSQLYTCKTHMIICTLTVKENDSLKYFSLMYSVCKPWNGCCNCSSRISRSSISVPNLSLTAC